ncbi:MAG TPA: hypothetical protein VF989_19105 [Polyangiaceae bacterium]
MPQLAIVEVENSVYESQVGATPAHALGPDDPPAPVVPPDPVAAPPTPDAVVVAADVKPPVLAAVVAATDDAVPVPPLPPLPVPEPVPPPSPESLEQATTNKTAGTSIALLGATVRIPSMCENLRNLSCRDRPRRLVPLSARALSRGVEGYATELSLSRPEGAPGAGPTEP